VSEIAPAIQATIKAATLPANNRVWFIDPSRRF
jgi:hypothetical protein